MTNPYPDQLGKLKHHWNVRTRREFFAQAGSGLASIALAAMLAEDGSAATTDPLAPKPPHVTQRAKNIIWCFMEGGPSQVDLFDPKPLLEKLAFEPVPPSFHPEQLLTAQGAKPSDGLLPARRTFKQRGQSGLWVSDWLPYIAEHADDLAVIRSCQSDAVNHVGGVCQMNTADILAGRPSLGAWVTYGLGSANRNLPTFIVMQDDKEILGSVQNYSSGFLPATYQGSLLRKGDTPILNLKPPLGTTNEEQRGKIALLEKMNGVFGRDKEDDSELDARTRSYELAYQMQSAAPEAIDLSKETEETKKLYGMNEPETAVYGTNCLMARRLVERGVRFVEVYSGSGSGWDAHQDVNSNHTKWCRASDKPIAGLLTDLKSRGMLKDTLVVWGGEFGRTPFAQTNGNTNRDKYGRDHNPWGFTMWMAGGGVKGGQTIGSTDEIGLRAVEEPHHIFDIHASILYLLGLNHLKTTYMRNGRAERPTRTGGNLITKLWA
jgi:hypothetical protein